MYYVHLMRTGYVIIIMYISNLGAKTSVYSCFSLPKKGMYLPIIYIMNIYHTFSKENKEKKIRKVMQI